MQSHVHALEKLCLWREQEGGRWKCDCGLHKL